MWVLHTDLKCNIITNILCRVHVLVWIRKLGNPRLANWLYIFAFRVQRISKSTFPSFLVPTCIWTRQVDWLVLLLLMWQRGKWAGRCIRMRSLMGARSCILCGGCRTLVTCVNSHFSLSPEFLMSRIYMLENLKLKIQLLGRIFLYICLFIWTRMSSVKIVLSHIIELNLPPNQSLIFPDCNGDIADSVFPDVSHWGSSWYGWSGSSGDPVPVWRDWSRRSLLHRWEWARKLARRARCMSPT